jgi:hypothetical protein
MIKTRLLITSLFTAHQKAFMPKYIRQNATKRAKLHTKAEASCDTHYRDFTVVEEGRKPALTVVNIDPDSQFTAAPPPSNPNPSTPCLLVQMVPVRC